MSINALTKEQLIACLENDGIKVDQATINRATKNVGIAAYEIGWKYHQKQIQYLKAMAWYRLAANQNIAAAYNNIGLLYTSGVGVSRDHDIALEYYLKAAGNNNYDAMENVAKAFLFGRGLRLDKYRALEWFIKYGDKPDRIKKLNDQGFHLKGEDKEKTVYQLIIEVEDILRKERKANTPTKRQLEQVKKGNKNLRDTAKKRDQKISSLEKDKQVMQQTITDLESSNKPSSDWDQKLKDKEESLNSLKQEINALKRSSGLFDMLVQLKNNEIGLLRKDNQRLGNLEQENRDLKRRLESLSSVDSNPTNIRIKTEEDELAPCKVGNKKRRTDS